MWNLKTDLVVEEYQRDARREAAKRRRKQQLQTENTDRRAR